MSKYRIINKKKKWNFLKNKVASGLELDYMERKYYYQVFVVEGTTKWYVNMFKPSTKKFKGASATNDADYNEFMTSYKDVPDEKPPVEIAPVTLKDVGTSESSGSKLAIHESSRPVIDGKFFHTVWSGYGDDVVTHEVGKGSNLMIESEIGLPKKSVDIEFDPIFGDVYLHEGYMQWKDAGWGDTLSAAIIAPASPLQTSINLDYEMDGNKLKFASGGPGMGTHGLGGTPNLVPHDQKQGYWNFDGTNLTYAPLQDGGFDIFDVEREVLRYINEVPIMGTSSNYVMLQSADTSLLPTGYKIRVTINNRSDTSWRAWIFMTLYREYTTMGDPE